MKHCKRIIVQRIFRVFCSRRPLWPIAAPHWFRLHVGWHVLGHNVGSRAAEYRRTDLRGRVTYDGYLDALRSTGCPIQIRAKT